MPGGGSKTLMIVRVSSLDKNVSESTCTLNFGQRVRAVELGAGVRRKELTNSEVMANFFHNVFHLFSMIYMGCIQGIFATVVVNVCGYYQLCFDFCRASTLSV